MHPDLLQTDHGLRAAFRNGERAAMAAVYSHYAPLVERIVGQGFGGFRGFGELADHEDAVQQVFLAAFSEDARLRYDGVRSYGGFLRGIAQNVVRQQLQKRNRFARPVPPDAAHAPPVDAGLVGREVAEVLGGFRGTLRQADRELLDLYFQKGLAEREVASRAGMTRYRVRVRVARLHRRLVRYLRKHGIDHA